MVLEGPLGLSGPFFDTAGSSSCLRETFLGLRRPFVGPRESSRYDRALSRAL